MRVLGIDVGGTFTDAVFFRAGELVAAKVPTRRAQEESVVEATRAVGAEQVERFTHGTTVATNALLERKGARTALVATAGSSTSCTCADRLGHPSINSALRIRSRSCRSSAPSAFWGGWVPRASSRRSTSSPCHA